MVDIVRLTPLNAFLLERLAPDVFDDPVNPDFLNAFLADPRHVMFLAMGDGEVIGMASGVEYFHPDKPPQLWINEVGVSPARQKQGIGRQLTSALVEEAKRRGCAFVWLATAQDNIPAQACFAKVPGGGPPQAVLVYDWELGNGSLTTSRSTA